MGSFGLASSSPTLTHMPLVFLQKTKLFPLLLSFARLNKPSSLECGWETHSRDLPNLGHQQEWLLGGLLGPCNAFTLIFWKQDVSLTARTVYLPPSPPLDNFSLSSAGQFPHSCCAHPPPAWGWLLDLHLLRSAVFACLPNLLHWIFGWQSCSCGWKPYLPLGSVLHEWAGCRADSPSFVSLPSLQ